LKLLFENWRRYLNEAERPGPGRTRSRYEQTAGPIAFDGFAKATYDATGGEGGFMEENESKQTFDSREKIIHYIQDNPNQKIYLDSPKGSLKGFGRTEKVALPFDYGEWPGLINPADDMGWDLIIVPSATKDDEPLVPVGHVEYSEERLDKQGNDKIIIAPNKLYTKEDKAIIDGFFNGLEGFEPPRWYK